MPRKIRWGVPGVANIAIRKIIPAMQHCESGEVVAIASRTLSKAKAAAGQLGIPHARGSYDELLADPDVDAIFNALPNHLHVPWSIKSASAGKHLLGEKPLGLSADEVRALIAARDTFRVKIGEAFMVRTHPQWLRAREVIRSDRAKLANCAPFRCCSAISTGIHRTFVTCGKAAADSSISAVTPSPCRASRSVKSRCAPSG